MILSLELLPPGEMSVDMIGAGVEGGRNLLGYPQAIDMTGGGIVGVRYDAIMPTNAHPRALLYLSRLGAKLNSGTNNIDVPLLIDAITPVIGSEDGIPSAVLEDQAFSDDTEFTDGTSYGEPLVWANIEEAAALNAGAISIRVSKGRTLYGGEWFSINHPTKGHRAYRITDVDSDTADGDDVVYSVGIRPTLREEVAGEEECRFVRPLCRMRLAPGKTIPFNVKEWWIANGSLEFIEAA